MSTAQIMATENSPTAGYILVHKTLTGELKWVSDETFKPDYFSGHAFRAEHQGELLRLYPRVRFEAGVDPRQAGHLEFIQPDGKVIWSFPPHSSIDDLLMVVERQSGDADVVENKLRKIIESA